MSMLERLKEAHGICGTLLIDLTRSPNADDVADVLAGLQAVQVKLVEVERDLRVVLAAKPDARLEAETRTIENVHKLLTAFQSQLHTLLKSNRLVRVLRQAGLRKKFESNLVALHRDLAELSQAVARMRELYTKKLQQQSQPQPSSQPGHAAVRPVSLTLDARPVNGLEGVNALVVSADAAGQAKPRTETQYARLHFDNTRAGEAPATLSFHTNIEDDPAYDPPAQPQSASLSSYSSFDDPAEDSRLVVSEYNLRGVMTPGFEAPAQQQFTQQRPVTGAMSISSVFSESSQRPAASAARVMPPLSRPLGPAPKAPNTGTGLGATTATAAPQQYGAFDVDAVAAIQPASAAPAAAAPQQYGSFDLGAAMSSQPAAAVAAPQQYGSFDLGAASSKPAASVAPAMQQYGGFDLSAALSASTSQRGFDLARPPAAAAANNAAAPAQYGSFDPSAKVAPSGAPASGAPQQYGAFDASMLTPSAAPSAVSPQQYGSFDASMLAPSAAPSAVSPQQYGSFDASMLTPSALAGAPVGVANYGSIDGIDCSAPAARIAATTIVQRDGQEFWMRFNDGRDYHVDVDSFANELADMIGEPLTAVERDVFGELLGVPVSAHKFSDFLKGFGPVKSCLNNLRAIFSKPWFQGFLNGNESMMLLDGEPTGSYFVRFSNSRPSAFVLVFVDRNRSVVQTLVESNHPKNGVRISERQPNGTDLIKEFSSIFEVMDYYTKSLRSVFTSEILDHEWFHGDLTSDEAAELLANQPIGTFLLRFSNQRGCYSSSFVTNRTNPPSVMHTRIVRTADGYCEPSSKQAWRTLDELVRSNSSMLRIPLANPRFVLRRMSQQSMLPPGYEAPTPMAVVSASPARAAPVTQTFPFMPSGPTVGSSPPPQNQSTQYTKLQFG